MKIGIIGAGMMGLTLAYRLSQKGHEIQLFESGSEIGGLSTWFDYGDFTFDKYYHVILKRDHHLLALIDELDLTDELHWQATKTGFLWKGKHVSMSNYLEFLRFPVLNIWEKCRLGAGILYSKFSTANDDTTATIWLTKIFGKDVYKKIWEPLLESKFGALKEKVPSSIIKSTLNRYSSTRSKADGKEYMGHLKGEGLKRLLEALKSKVNGSVTCDARVESVEGGTISTSAGTHTFDTVLSTIPTALLKKICPQIHSETPTPEFLGVIRLALVLKESLSPFYVTNLIDKGLPYTGIIEVSALTTEEELAGHKLIMVPRYDVPGSKWFQKSDAEIQDCFIASLKQTWPEIENNIVKCFVHRERVVQALWTQAPPNLLPARSTCGKIWSVNAELAGRDTLNNNAIVKVAGEFAEAFCD